MLDQQQSDFLKAVFLGNCVQSSSDKVSIEEKGLEVYQYSLIANTARAFSITFATAHSYMGKKAFDELVASYLKIELKTEYDWGEFGKTFPDYISTQKIEHAFLLSELAKLDLLCHQAERSKDVTSDLTTLNLLSEHDAYELYITLNSGMALMQSSIALDDLNQTITQLTEEGRITQLSDVTKVLNEFSSEFNTSKNDNEIYNFVVWRPDFQAQYTRITDEEYQWLSLLMDKGKIIKNSIGQALDEINNENFSLVEWLPKAIQEQLINGITTQP